MQDCQSQIAPGIYGLAENTQNTPFRYGHVICFPHSGNNDQIKIAFNVSGGYPVATMVGAGSWVYFDRVTA